LNYKTITSPQTTVGYKGSLKSTLIVYKLRIPLCVKKTPDL